MGEGSIYDNETRGYRMSTLTVLKKYLVGEGGYLLNDDNNGKTVMLSGAWGSGKTHFWKEEIIRVQEKIIENEEENDKYILDKYQKGLSYKLNEREKACVYISLYGKDSLEDIKQEVFFKASTENDYLSDDIEAFGYQALSTISDTNGVIGTLFKSAMDINEYRREGKGKNKLKNGGLICFDDFERKSKNIDLNDLFGFISQLAISLKCKVVVILNSDVFKGEEANVFKTVKEKTVNKFFYFGPTRKELFDSIYYRPDEKYESLNNYIEDIFNAIDEIEELNARIYIQVLDNCLEWIEKGYELNLNICKPLVLSSIFFVKHHYSFYIDNLESADKVYDMYHAFNENIELAKNIRNIFPQYASGNTMTKDDIIHSLKVDVTKKKKDNNDNENAEIYYASGYKLLEDNKYMLRDFYIYKYLLKIDDAIDAELFNDINMFIKTGILSRKETDI